MKWLDILYFIISFIGFIFSLVQIGIIDKCYHNNIIDTDQNMVSIKISLIINCLLSILYFISSIIKFRYQTMESYLMKIKNNNTYNNDDINNILSKIETIKFVYKFTFYLNLFILGVQAITSLIIIISYNLTSDEIKYYTCNDIKNLMVIYKWLFVLGVILIIIPIIIVTYNSLKTLITNNNTSNNNNTNTNTNNGESKSESETETEPILKSTKSYNSIDV